MSGLQKASGGRKNRKHKRDKTHCESYARENRRELNKSVRLIKHVARQPNDRVGAGALDRCFAIVSRQVVARYIEKKRGNRLTARTPASQVG